MYHVSTQCTDERIINVHYYYKHQMQIDRASLFLLLVHSEQNQKLSLKNAVCLFLYSAAISKACDLSLLEVHFKFVQRKRSLAQNFAHLGHSFH